MEIFLFILITIHLFFGLVFCGGPLLAVAEPFRSTNSAWQIVKQQLMQSIYFGLVTAVAGCLLIGLLWDSPMEAAFTANKSRLIFLCMEFAFSILLVWVVCQFFPKPPAKLFFKFLASGLLFFAATNSIYHFPSLMVVMREIRTSIPSDSIQTAHYKQYLFDGVILSKWIHIMAASIAVTGIWNRFNTLWEAFSSKKLSGRDCLELNQLDKRQAIWIGGGIFLSWLTGFFALSSTHYLRLVNVSGNHLSSTAFFVSGVLISFILVIRNMPKNWDINEEETNPVGMNFFDRTLDLTLLQVLLYAMVQAVDRSSV